MPARAGMPCPRSDESVREAVRRCAHFTRTCGQCTCLELIQPDADRLLVKQAAGIHGYDLEFALVQVHANHAAVGVDQADLSRSKSRV